MRTKEIATAVSVIVPVYNMGKYLRECLDSVLSQTLQNIEVLCVNDGSTDDSLSILLEYAERDARVKVISQENQGVAVARNHALQMAGGEYIAFMDPDDWYPSADVLESLFNAAEMHRVEIAGGSWSIYKDGIVTQVYDVGYLFKSEGVINYRDYQFEYGYHRFLYRRLFLIENNLDFPLYKRYQDPPFFVKAMLAAKQFYAIPKIVYAYRKGHKDIDWTQEKILDVISGLRDISVLSRNENLAALHCCNYRRLTGIAPIIQNFEDMSLEIIAKLFELEQSLYIPFLEQGISDFEKKALVSNLIAECLYKWLNTLPVEDKAAGFDEIVSRWGSIEVVGKLAQKYFNQRAEWVHLVKGATSLTYDGRKIKTVLCYAEKLNDGGSERVVCALCRLWSDMGYRVILLTNEEATSEDYLLSVEGVVHIVLENKNCFTAENYQNRAKEWAQILRKYEVDAVVYHPYGRPVFLWDELVIKVSGVAVIGYWHSVFSVGFSDKWKWKDIANFFAPYELADALVVLSDTNRAFFRYYNGNVYTAINPITENLQDWKQNQFVAKHDILWCGRLAPFKNPLDFISIMKMVLSEVPDAVLHVVGRSADGKMEKILEKRIKEENLDGHIMLEGFFTDVKSWYLSSRVFLMTSDLEGYPMALAESKMAGLPCVMYELPYLTLCEGNRGILAVLQHDTKAAAKAIIRLLQDDAFCEQCGKEARAHIEELAQFDFQKKWRDIFESVEKGHSETVTETEKRMMDMLVGEYMKENDRATKAEAKSRKVSQEIRDIRHGYSFRVGRVVTWFPRKIRGGIRCFRQHGVVYTAKRTLEHWGIDMGTKDFSGRK